MGDRSHERTPMVDGAGLPEPQAIAQPSAGPVLPDERIVAIDVLRGFAVLGIFVMNVPTFALSRYAFMDPTIHGMDTSLDEAGWLASHVLFEMKMMSLFSLLFGAGLMIIAQRQQRRREGWLGGNAAAQVPVSTAASMPPRPAVIIYRRLGVLALIGLVHAYVVWEGDILLTYAVLGALAFVLWRLPAGVLLALGCLLLPVGVLSNYGFGWFFGEARAAWEAQQAGQTLSGFHAGIAESWPDIHRDFNPTDAMLAEEAAAFEGGYFDLLPSRAQQAFFIQVPMMLMFSVWRIGGLMLLGMALVKAGALRGAWSAKAYGIMAALGLVLGLPIVFLGAMDSLAHDFDVVRLFKVGWNANYVGSLLVAMGYFGAVFLACKAGILVPVQRALAAVGRLALTNYLAQSLIGAGLFYGYGVGLWGELGRAELLLVVAAVWTAQIAFSIVWLRYRDFGPLEWLWRRLAYPSGVH